MREYFEEQLKESVPISEDIVDKLGDKPRYGKYEVGDRVCMFLEQKMIIEGDNKPIVNIRLIPVCEKDLDKLLNDYYIIRVNDNRKIPILCPK